jgi:hypothetical protein
MYSQKEIMKHLSQQTTSGSVTHIYSNPPFGYRNAIVGLSTMINFMTNAHDGKQ